MVSAPCKLVYRLAADDGEKTVGLSTRDSASLQIGPSFSRFVAREQRESMQAPALSWPLTQLLQLLVSSVGRTVRGVL